VCDCHDLGDYKDLFCDEEILYRRVREQEVRNGKVTPANCPTRQWKEGLSCDWSVMTTPEDAAKGLPYLLTITVSQCRDLGLDVRYCPHLDPDDPFYNLAHCLLILPPNMGKRDIAEVRQRFLNVAVLRRTQTD